MDRRVLIGDSGTSLDVEVATSRRERARGLLGRDRLPTGEGLLIPRARSVHTIGMRFAIDVAFLDRDLRVIDVRHLPPGRVTRPRVRARHVLECNPGHAPVPGERLAVRQRRSGRGSPIYSSLPPGR